MSKQDVRDYPLSIAANSQIELNVSGRFIRCLSSSLDDFLIMVDDGTEYFFASGIEYRLPIEQQDFKKVTIKNNNGSTLTIRLAVGYGVLKDDRRNFSGSVTTKEVVPQVLDDDPVTTVASGSQTTIITANTDRVALHITNHAPAGSGYSIMVGDAPGAGGAGTVRGIIIPPQSTFTLYTTALVRCWHENGVDIDVACTWTERN